MPDARLRLRPWATLGFLLLGALLQLNCSLRKFAIGKLGDALAQSGSTYASDDDPELVKDALPFALKLIEGLLEQRPEHRGLLLAAAGGFTQYAYAFVQQPSEETDSLDAEGAAALRLRARNLYLRARDYGMRGLEAAHPDFGRSLHADAAAALGSTQASDVPFLYWTAVSWGAAISLSKDDPDRLADLPLMEALVRRALQLDEAFDFGALHEFMITFEGSRSDTMGGSTARARQHFQRATQLSEGRRAAPYVALAESVSVRLQDRAEFETLLKKALAVDVNARPEWRLSNLVMQRRARWLLGRADYLFVD